VLIPNLLRSKPSRFLYSGVVLTLYAFGLNLLLIERFHLYKPLAYALVILTQLLLGFVLNRFHVFNVGNASTRPLLFRYAVASFLFRFTDWASFTIQVQYFSIFYIYAQLFNLGTIPIVKYFLYKKIFERKDANVK